MHTIARLATPVKSARVVAHESVSLHTQYESLSERLRVTVRPSHAHLSLALPPPPISPFLHRNPIIHPSLVNESSRLPRCGMRLDGGGTNYHLIAPLCLHSCSWGEFGSGGTGVSPCRRRRV